MTTPELDVPQQLDVYAFALGAIEPVEFQQSLSAYPFPTQVGMVRLLREVARNADRPLTDEQKQLFQQYRTLSSTDQIADDDGC